MNEPRAKYLRMKPEDDDELAAYWARRAARWRKIHKVGGFILMAIAIGLSFFVWLGGEYVRAQIWRDWGWLR